MIEKVTKYVCMCVSAVRSLACFLPSLSKNVNVVGFCLEFRFVWLRLLRLHSVPSFALLVIDADSHFRVSFL